MLMTDTLSDWGGQMPTKNKVIPLIASVCLFAVGALFANASLADTAVRQSISSSEQNSNALSLSPTASVPPERASEDTFYFPPFKSFAPTQTPVSPKPTPTGYANIFALKMKGMVGEDTWARLITNGLDPEKITYDNVRYCIYKNTADGLKEYEFCADVSDGSISDGWFDYPAKIDGPQEVIDVLESMLGSAVSPYFVFQDGSANCVNQNQTVYCYDTSDGSKYTKTWTQDDEGNVTYSDPIPFLSSDSETSSIITLG